MILLSMPDNILQCREEREGLWDVDVLIDGDSLVHLHFKCVDRSRKMPSSDHHGSGFV